MEGRGSDDLSLYKRRKQEDEVAHRGMFGMDTSSGATCAAMMTRQSPRYFYVVRSCTQFVLSRGYACTVLQADSEPAMRDMMAPLTVLN